MLDLCFAEMDSTTASGASPSYIAQRIVDAVQYYQKDVLLAPFSHRLAVYLKNLVPDVFAQIMESRAKKQRLH